MHSTINVLGNVTLIVLHAQVQQSALLVVVID